MTALVQFARRDQPYALVHAIIRGRTWSRKQADTLKALIDAGTRPEQDPLG